MAHLKKKKAFIVTVVLCFSEPPQPSTNCSRANGFFPFPANESCQKFWDCRGGKINNKKLSHY